LPAKSLTLLEKTAATQWTSSNVYLVSQSYHAASRSVDDPLVQYPIGALLSGD
jgi:hypothetical protein